MATGDISAATLLDSSPHKGWVLRPRVVGWSAATGVALVNGLSSTPKGVLNVSSPGYDATGSTATVTRTVYLKTTVKKVYPDFTTPDTTTSGSDMDIKSACSDWIYASDSLTLDAASGLFTSNLGSSNAASGLSVTNSSTKAYSAHKVVGHWAVEQFRPVNGNTLIEFVCVNGHARNQKMVACVKITATGQTSGASVTSTVTQLTKSATDNVPVYAATLDISTTNGFTRGEVVKIQAQAYPWVGDSGAVLDSTGSTSSVNFGELLYTVMDKVIAVVDPSTGDDTTGVASPTQGTADAAPCLTIAGAVAKIKAYNNSTHSLNRADGGEVQLKAGNYLHGVNGGNAADTVNGYVTITYHSSTNRAGVVFTAGHSGSDKYAWNKQRLKDVTVTLAANFMMFQNVGAVCVFDHVDFTASFVISGGDGCKEFINGCTIQAATCASGAADDYTRLNRGSVLASGSSSGGYFFPRARCLIGVTANNCTGGIWTNTLADSAVKPIIWYCEFTKITGSLFVPASNLDGVGVVETLFEGMDSSVVSEFGNFNITNFCWFNVSTPGNRCNWQAGWSTGPTNNTLEMFVRSSAFAWFAWKGDEYSTGYATLTASWPAKYGVGWYDNVSEKNEFPPEDFGVGSSYGVLDAGWVDDQSYDNNVAPGSGNGDYLPASGSTLLNRAPTLRQAVPWDLDGTSLGASAAAGALQPIAPVGDPAPRYMWWACGAGSYTVAGLPQKLREEGWEAMADDVFIPRFQAFNDDDEALCIIHAPAGRSRDETGDIPFDALLLRRQEAEFPLVYDVEAFGRAMKNFYDACGQYPALYYGTIHGTEYDKWHRLSPQAFRKRVLDSLAQLLTIPRAHRKIILDTAGVFGPAKGRQHPLMFGDRAWAQTETRRFPRTLQEPDTRGIAGVGSGVYYSGSTTRIPSRFGGILAILKEIGIAGLGIEPRARLETGWEHGDETVDWWTTSQLMDSSNDTESGSGSGWCLSSARCNGTFGVLVTDSRTEGEIATWLYGDPDNGVPAKAVAIGGLSDPGVTSSDMTGYVPA